MSNPKPTRVDYLALCKKMNDCGTVYHDVIKRADGSRRRYLKVKNMLPLDAQVIWLRAVQLFGHKHVKLYKASIPYWKPGTKRAEPDAVSIVLTSYWDFIKE